MTLPNTLPKFIIYFLKPYKWPALIFVLMAFFAGFWGPFNSQILKWLIDALPQAQGNISSLYLPASLLAINFLVFDNVTWRTINYIEYKYTPNLKNDIISAVYSYVLKHSHQYYQDNLSGRVASQIDSLADNVVQIFWPCIPNFLRGASLVIVALISAYYVNIVFAVMMSLWLLVFISFSVIMSTKIVNLADDLADKETKISGELVDAISNVSNIRLFARKAYEVVYLGKFLRERKDVFQTQQWFLIKLFIAQGILISVMLAFAAYFLVYFYEKGMVSIGDFALILGLTMEVGHMIWFTVYQFDEFNKHVGKCKQCLSHLIVPHTVIDSENATKLEVSHGRITFYDVKFHYKGTAPLFQNISIEIKVGQKVGLVGYSGGGKTTFANLILRIYDVTEGAILIDGQDIKYVTQDSLRESIAMIPQDPSLFHRSIMDNIRYGRISTTDEEVIDAAKKAHAHEFILALPQGYESLVGERGVKLSGGQRQRIAIARAILKNAPILILDEATSQLDSVTESMIQESLLELMQNKTTIVIAHRLSTLQHMDRILVFDKGKIVGDGAHNELLAKGGLYKRLWDAQVGGFLGDNATKLDEEES